MTTRRLSYPFGIVRHELERPFVADLNSPVTQSQLALPESKTDELLEKLGQRMFSRIVRMTPASAKALLGEYKQLEIERIHPITTRYLDWK
jgi:hypothetical protein